MGYMICYTTKKVIQYLVLSKKIIYHEVMAISKEKTRSGNPKQIPPSYVIRK